MTVPAPTMTVRNPEFEELVGVRAHKLCRSAPPHGNVGACPCDRHLSEARLALFDQWLRESQP